MLVDQFSKNKSISFSGCALQFFVFGISINSESLLLAVMAYDWYKAVSSPLLYVVSMSSGVCSLLVAGVYLVGMADALIHMTLAFHLCFCGSNQISHFFCDLAPLFLLSCSDIQVNELVLFIIFTFIALRTISEFLSLIVILPFQSWRSSLLRGGSKLFPLHLPPNCSASFPGNYALYIFQAEFILIL